MFLKHIACHGPLLRKKSHAYIFVICFQRYLYDLKYIIITILVLLLRFVKYLANIAFALRHLLMTLSLLQNVHFSLE